MILPLFVKLRRRRRGYGPLTGNSGDKMLKSH